MYGCLLCFHLTPPPILEPKAWIFFLVFYKNEMQNKAWLKVRSEFLYFNASNRWRLLEAKAACLSAAWLSGDRML